MNKVYSLSEAMEWFLSHASGSVICVNGDNERKCASYPEAKEFYNG